MRPNDLKLHRPPCKSDDVFKSHASLPVYHQFFLKFKWIWSYGLAYHDTFKDVGYQMSHSKFGENRVNRLRKVGKKVFYKK